ncbi:MAG TPA: energy transducer TonB [Gemmatimonadaceae bacterium]|nr:energy transducer TonB [Gemmatimonadaceae bacterium]
MLRLLLESNTRGFQFRQGAFVSLVAHALLISASVFATRGGPEAAIEKSEEKVTFLIPMNRTNSPPPREESVQFLREGEKAGTGGTEEKIIDRAATREAPVLGLGPDEGKPEEVAPPIDPNAVYDTVATAVDVDSMVTRFSESVAPSYPAKLLEMKIEGGAYVQFVVDTTGLADTLSFRVISSTHPEFAQSVREALPNMRFHPAILRSRKVRQLVEQPFMFKIVIPPKATTQAKP